MISVLFDLDGTLLDTAPDLAGALNRLRVSRGEAPLPLSVIRPTVSAGTPAMLKCAFDVTPDHPEFSTLIRKFLGFYVEGIADETTLFPGMAEVLHGLEARGIPWGVVTNKPHYLTEPLMRALQLWERAACVVSGDTLPTRKPDPEPLLYACAQIGAAPAQSLYIGDADRDIEAGRRAGMITLIADFGYVTPEDHPEDWGATGRLAQPADIWHWLPLPLSEPLGI